MGIAYLDGFDLTANETHEKDDLVKSGLNSIGNLSDMAEACASVAAALNDGSIPSDAMTNKLLYASVTLSSLAQKTSDVIGDLEPQPKK